MKHVLLTGFEPFGEFKINSSRKALRRLREHPPGDFQLTTLEVPNRFDDVIQVTVESIEEHDPDVIICLGQSRRNRITVERSAVNIKNADFPDNAGYQPEEESIVSEGPDAYLSTLPVPEIVDELRSNGIPANISNDAGTFVCNNQMYGVLHHLAQNDREISAGFIHVPCLPSQVVEKGGASWPVDVIEKGLRLAMKTSLDVSPG